MKKLLFLAIVLGSMMTFVASGQTGRKAIIIKDTVYSVSIQPPKALAIFGQLDENEIRALIENQGKAIRCKLFRVDNVFYHPNDFFLTKTVYQSNLLASYQNNRINYSLEPTKYQDDSQELWLFLIAFFLASFISSLHKRKLMGLKSLQAMWVIIGTILIIAASYALDAGDGRLFIATGSLIIVLAVISFIANQLVFHSPTIPGSKPDDEEDVKDNIIFFSNSMSFLLGLGIAIVATIITGYFLAGLYSLIASISIYLVNKYVIKFLAKPRFKKPSDPTPELAVA